MNLHTLMYHDVLAPYSSESSGFNGPGADHYKLDQVAFQRHLDALRDAAVTVMNPSQLARIAAEVGASARGVLLTFDDGGNSAATVIASELEGRGVRGIFFVTTGRLGSPGFMTMEQVSELASRGHLVGSHSVSHPSNISQLSDGDLLLEWQRSVETLSEATNGRVETASVPGGFYSRRVAQAAAKAGIRYLFTSEPTAKIEQVDGCYVLGRYTITRATSPEAALGYALGQRRYVLPQACAWQAKKVLKRVAATPYAQLRRWMLSDVRSTTGVLHEAHERQVPGAQTQGALAAPDAPSRGV